MAVLRYSTTHGDCTYFFDFTVEDGAYQGYILQGTPYPSNLVTLDETPPGCEKKGDRYRIRWFSLASLVSLGQAKSLAASWAEDTARFIGSGIWLVTYRTNDGSALFKFSIEKKADTIKVFIVDQPSYRGRDTGSHPTHRLIDGGRYYICWDSPLKKWADAEDVAALWSEKTREYIAAGKHF